MRFCTVLAFLCFTALACPAFAKAPPPVTDEAQRVYDRAGDAVYQVQVIDLASERKSGIGSGFQFTKDGLIATNYHVVARAVTHPGNNRLEYLHDRGGRGILKVLAVDVLRDLAILKMDTPGRIFLSLGSSALPKGARLFALGNPHDLGFTIIEGTYNGLSKESFVDKIHFSGSLNPGMSGGPAVSHAGKVVGVNVSTAGNQISFLVPVEPLKALAEKAARGEGEEKEEYVARAASDIEAQLLEGQARNLGALLGNKKWDSVPLGPLMVPGRVHDALKCWGVPVHEEKDPFRYYRSVCSSQDRLFLGDDFDTGTVSYRYDYIVGKEEMDPLRFTAFYERQYGAPVGEADAREDNITNFECNARFVRQAGRKWKASFCVRQYRRYPAVYDLLLAMALVDGKKEGMIISLDAEGVSRENALALAARFISEIREKPAAGKDKKEGAAP